MFGVIFLVWESHQCCSSNQLHIIHSLHTPSQLDLLPKARQTNASTTNMALYLITALTHLTRSHFHLHSYL